MADDPVRRPADRDAARPKAWGRRCGDGEVRCRPLRAIQHNRQPDDRVYAVTSSALSAPERGGAVSIFLRPCLIIVGVCRCWSQHRDCAQTTDVAVNQAYASIDVPKDLFDLFVNIKFVMDRDLLLREAFYKDEVLRRFFGGSKIIWQRENEADKFVEIARFGSMLEPVEVAGRMVGGLTMYAHRAVTPDRKAKGRLTLSFINPMRPDFDDVERIFGKDWKYPPPTVASPHKAFRSPTRLHGNEQIIYEISKPPISSYSRFEFAFDGMIELADFSMEGPVQP